MLPATVVPMAVKYQDMHSNCAMHAVACCPALNNTPRSMLRQSSLRSTLERDLQICSSESDMLLLLLLVCCPVPSAALPSQSLLDTRYSAAEEPEEPPKPEVVTSLFTPDIESAVKQFVERWQTHDEGQNALPQKHEPELVKGEMRPLVFEEVRQQVDTEMSVLLQNLKVGPGLCRASLTGCRTWRELLLPAAAQLQAGLCR